MERSTALSAAGALTVTAAAAVSALFLTVDRGAADASEPTTPAVAESEVVTQYEVVTVDGTESQIVEPASTESAMDDATLGDTEHTEGEEHEDEYPEGEEHAEDEHPESEEYPEDEMEDEDEDDD